MNKQDNYENTAGKSTRQLAQGRREKRKNIGIKAAVLIFTATAILLTYLYFGHPAIVITSGLVILFLMLVKKVDWIVTPEMDNLFRREGHAVKGAQAEEEIGELLGGLGAAYQVLHDLKTDCGNIDHLIFRKDGAIFLIETKSHYGKITQQNGQLRRNGQFLEKDFIKQTLNNVSWLKKILKERTGFDSWIHAAVVFTNAHVETHLNLAKIDVFNASYLTRWMGRTRGNPRIAVILWPQVETLKNELASPNSNHLACSALLH